MSRPLSDAFRTALYARETGEVLAILLTLRLTLADGTVETLRRTTEPGGLTSKGETYTEQGIGIVLPSEPESGSPRASLVLDNVDRDLGIRIRRAMSGECDLALVLAAAPDNVEVQWPKITLGNFKWTVERFTAELGYDTGAREPYPAWSMTPASTPGIV